MNVSFSPFRLNSLPFLFACLFPLKTGPFLAGYTQFDNTLDASRAFLPQSEPGPNTALKTNTVL